MNEQEYINEIRGRLLQKRPSYETTNKKEVHVRCPYCGDHSAHLYIEMRPPFRFHCFKCETAGVLNQKVLNDLEIYDNNMAVNIIESNKSIKESGVQKLNFTNKKIIPCSVFNEQQALNALQYFNNRYETNLSPEYITEKFKVILNSPEFFYKNRVFVPAGIYDYTNSIGFISSDGSHAVFRDITGQQKSRYNNLNLMGNYDLDTASKIYNIQSDINIMSEKITLVITEGIFDIIGVYLHFYKGMPQEQNTIFAAACGKGYNAVISHYIRMGFLNMNVVIYSDADVDISFLKTIKSASPYLKNNLITVYYNTLEKDFGVPKHRINLKKAII